MNDGIVQVGAGYSLVRLATNYDLDKDGTGSNLLVEFLGQLVVRFI